MENLNEILKNAIDNALINTHTATIGRVVKVNDTTIDVQPVINHVHNGVDVKLPIFPKVPPVFLQGGASYDAHPIAVGDYCLLIVAERAFDNWYAGSDEVRPPERRMHDYSDTFAIVGVNPLAKAINIPATIVRKGNSTVTGDYVHEGDYDITGNVTINGNLTVKGDIDCTGRLTVANATIAGIDFTGHVHGGVQTGGSNTGAAQ